MDHGPGTPTLISLGATRAGSRVAKGFPPLLLSKRKSQLEHARDSTLNCAMANLTMAQAVAKQRSSLLGNRGPYHEDMTCLNIMHMKHLNAHAT